MRTKGYPAKFDLVRVAKLDEYSVSSAMIVIEAAKQ